MELTIVKGTEVLALDMSETIKPQIIRFIKSGKKPNRTEKYSSKTQTKRRLIGVLVSFQWDNKIYIGFSKCSKKDVFDKEIGLNMAAGRAQSLIDSNKFYDIPVSLTNHYVEFCDRSKRYFKDATLSTSSLKSLNQIK